MADIVMSRPANTKTMFHRRRLAAQGAARWLGLAAAPAFVVMALLTALGGSGPDMVCVAVQDTWPLGGMVPMYLLMSVFHLTPWLKLISCR